MPTTDPIASAARAPWRLPRPSVRPLLLPLGVPREHPTGGSALISPISQPANAGPIAWRTGQRTRANAAQVQAHDQRALRAGGDDAGVTAAAQRSLVDCAMRSQQSGAGRGQALVAVAGRGGCRIKWYRVRRHGTCATWAHPRHICTWTGRPHATQGKLVVWSAACTTSTHEGRTAPPGRRALAVARAREAPPAGIGRAVALVCLPLAAAFGSRRSSTFPSPPRATLARSACCWGTRCRSAWLGRAVHESVQHALVAHNAIGRTRPVNPGTLLVPNGGRCRGCHTRSARSSG